MPSSPFADAIKKRIISNTRTTLGKAFPEKFVILSGTPQTICDLLDSFNRENSQESYKDLRDRIIKIIQDDFERSEESQTFVDCLLPHIESIQKNCAGVKYSKAGTSPSILEEHIKYLSDFFAHFIVEKALSEVQGKSFEVNFSPIFGEEAQARIIHNITTQIKADTQKRAAIAPVIWDSSAKLLITNSLAKLFILDEKDSACSAVSFLFQENKYQLVIAANVSGNLNHILVLDSLVNRWRQIFNLLELLKSQLEGKYDPHQFYKTCNQFVKDQIWPGDQCAIQQRIQRAAHLVAQALLINPHCFSPLEKNAFYAPVFLLPHVEAINPNLVEEEDEHFDASPKSLSSSFVRSVNSSFFSSPSKPAAAGTPMKDADTLSLTDTPMKARAKGKAMPVGTPLKPRICNASPLNKSVLSMSSEYLATPQKMSTPKKPIRFIPSIKQYELRWSYDAEFSEPHAVCELTNTYPLHLPHLTSTRFLHAEQLIGYLLFIKLKIEILEKLPIGISKLCCATCADFYQEFTDKVLLRGGHLNRYRDVCNLFTNTQEPVGIDGARISHDPLSRELSMEPPAQRELLPAPVAAGIDENPRYTKLCM